MTPADRAEKNADLNIALIGCGKMGGALLKGWLAEGITDRIYVLDPAGPSEEFSPLIPSQIEWFENIDEFTAQDIQADIFVLAVKPQIMEDVCRRIKDKIPHDSLVLSIAAGQTIALFEDYFGAGQPVVRTMPNTPSAIGKGMTVAVANRNVSVDRRVIADLLMGTVGMTEWLEDEALLNAVTAVSGSGPAYVFLLMEAMAEAGKKCGLDQELAMKLARQTVIGSAALAEKEPDTTATRLRENVTSPGGTTAAALDILMQDNRFHDLMAEAVAAAAQRGKDLAS